MAKYERKKRKSSFRMPRGFWLAVVALSLLLSAASLLTYKYQNSVFTISFDSFSSFLHSLKNIEGAFLTSFIASMWESILFFIIIGLITTYITLSRPHEDSFDNRLAILYSNPKAHKDARDNVRSEAQQLAAYIESCKSHIRIEDIKTVNKQTRYKIHVTCLSHFCSLIENEPYIGPVDFQAEADAYWSGKIGGCINQVSSETVSDKTQTIHIQNEKFGKQFTERIEHFSIGIDDKTKLEYDFWVTALPKIEYYQIFHRYCVKVNIDITNNTNTTIKITNLTSNQRRNKNLKSGQSIRLINGSPIARGSKKLFEIS
ncbi:hypothetical protein ABWH92_09965 [Ahrensia marina]|uniref:hypothetical protein n=1 Tax=Ahrensia marina TaxID=1514904 RepID=UPI0035CF9C5B